MIALALLGLGVLAGGSAAAEGPDLVVSELDEHTHELVAGEEVEVDAEVRNEGQATANASEVSFQLDDGRTFTADVSALEPGEDTFVEERWTAQAGNHTLSVVADAGENVAETNEENNELVTTYTVDERPEPDLQPADVWVDAWPYDAVVDGDEATMGVTVENAAEPDHHEEDAAAGTFTVEVRRDGELVERTRTDHELDPGERHVVEVGPWTAAAGDHNVTVTVDIAGEVDETDETDNEETFTYTVLETPPDPNLAPVDLRPARETIVAGQPVSFEAEVDHSGEAVEDVEAQVAVDGRALASPFVGDLGRGLDAGISTPAWTATAGQHEVSVDLDPRDTVAETDETDNRASATFHVLQRADPSVSEVSVAEPAVPWSGHLVQVELANVGAGPAIEPVELEAEVCPAEPTPTPGCRVLEVPAEVTLNDEGETVVETSWSAEGAVGEFQVCAGLGYGPPQTTSANDERCASTYAVAAAGATGGVWTT